MDDEHSRNADESDMESSLPYSVDYSDLDTESLSESIGSVESVSSKPTPIPKPQTLVWRPKKDSNSRPQFLQFSREMRDVSVGTAWGLFRNFRITAAGIIPGVIASFEWVEGEGTTGSCFMITFTPQCTRPGEENYAMNKVEALDDVAHMSAMRCVSGKYMKQFKLFLTFMKVVPHAVLGDNSCVVIYRLEYLPREPGSAVSEQTILAYKRTVDLLRDWHCILDRVHRPLVNHEMSLANTTKRLRTRAGQSRICADEQKPAVRLERRRKSRIQVLENDEEAVGRDRPQGNLRPRRNSRIQPV